MRPEPWGRRGEWVGGEDIDRKRVYWFSLIQTVGPLEEEKNELVRRKRMDLVNVLISSV